MSTTLRVATDILAADYIKEKTSAQGVEIQNTLKLTSVADDLIPTKYLTIETDGTVRSSAPSTQTYPQFVDDFSNVARGVSDSLTEAFVIADKPWYIVTNALSELNASADFGGSIVNPYNDMIGAVYFNFTTPSSLTQRYMTMANGANFAQANGKITAIFRLRLQETASTTNCFDQLSFAFGLGRDSNNAGTFDLNGVVGFRYSFADSIADNWAAVHGGAGATTFSSNAGATPADEFTHTFKITVEYVDATNSTVNWYIDNVLYYTQTVQNLTRLGPRLVYSYTKNSNALPANGVGFVVDLVQITQESYSR